MEAAIDASYRFWKHQARARSIHGVCGAASRFRKVLLQGQQGQEIVCARSGEIIGSDSLPREKREELGDEVTVDGEVPVDGGKLELRWPPWEGLPERYMLIGAPSFLFVIRNKNKIEETWCFDGLLCCDTYQCGDMTSTWRSSGK